MIVTTLWRFLWQGVLDRFVVERAHIVSAVGATPLGTLYQARGELALRWCDLKIDVVSALLGKKAE